MKAKEIEVGGLYTAKISGKLVRVKVLAIRDQQRYGGKDPYSGKVKIRDKVVYDVQNLTTGRTVTFRSAGKFRAKADTCQHSSGVGHPPPVVNTVPRTTDHITFQWYKGPAGQTYTYEIAKDQYGNLLVRNTAGGCAWASVDRLLSGAHSDGSFRQALQEAIDKHFPRKDSVEQ